MAGLLMVNLDSAQSMVVEKGSKQKFEWDLSCQMQVSGFLNHLDIEVDKRKNGKKFCWSLS